MFLNPHKRGKTYWYKIKVLVFIVLFIPFQVNAIEINLVEHAPGIFVHQGKHHGLDAPEREDIANIGYIQGNNCIAVIDTGGSIALGEAFYKSIKDNTDVPICYVINTHVHFDHVLGNAAFKSSKTSFIGHYNLRDELQGNKAFFIENFLDELGGEKNPDLIITPDKIVETKLELDLGNRKLVLQAHPQAHTHTDLSIYDTQTKTLWLSDLLFVERTPVLDGSLKGWLNVMEELNNMEIQNVIPGHGKFDIAPAKALAQQKEYLQSLLTETRAMIQQGAFMEEVIAEVGQGQKEKWQLFDEQHKRNVSRAFVELEWE